MLTVVTVTDLVPQELLAPGKLGLAQEVARGVMEGAREFWIKRAGEKLHSSRRDYADGIQEVEVGPGWAQVVLTGVLPLMVEQGVGPFDLHDTLLGPAVPIAGPGRKGKHVNAEGKFYRAIPFRHQGPMTLGQGGGAPMGSQYYRGAPAQYRKAWQQDLGKAIMAKARQLTPTVGTPGSAVAYGGRLPAGLAPKLRASPAVVGGRLQAPHATDIYAGMIKAQKDYAKRSQPTYRTFRTISEAVPDKWMHPGITAANLVAEVEKYVADEAPRAFLAATLGGPPP